MGCSWLMPQSIAASRAGPGCPTHSPNAAYEWGLPATLEDLGLVAQHLVGRAGVADAITRLSHVTPVATGGRRGKTSLEACSAEQWVACVS